MAERELWWWLWATIAAAAASLLLHYLTTPNNRRRRVPARSSPRWRAPGPRPLPLIGNLLDLRAGNGPLHHTLARLARAHGAPVMRLQLGLVPAVVISTAAAAREALTAHDGALAARAVPDGKRALGFCDRSMIWLPSSAPLWRTLRAVAASQVFSPRGLAATRAVRERKVRDLVDHLRARARDGTAVVGVRDAVYGGVANLVSCSLFSADVVDDAGDAGAAAGSASALQQLVEDLIACIARPNVSDFFPFLRHLDLQGRRRWVAGRLRKVFKILDDIIDRRLAETAASSSTVNASDFLDVLVELLSAGRITRDNVTMVLFDLFTAGSDTMALTVEWAMAELLRNPGAMAKLRAEMTDSLAGKDAVVEEADVEKLPYLRAVVKEAMRLHPVAPVMLPHRAVEDGVEVAGVAVPEGCAVIFNVWAIMRDPAAWERPNEFVPERFLLGGEAGDGGAPGKQQFEFIPFGAGRRVCPGVPMAERVVPLVLASLVRAFEWRLPDGVSPEQVDVTEKFTTANVLAVPLKAVPVIITT